MNYLIDTQILIWFQLNDNQLKTTIHAILSDPNNTIFLSEVSLYEIAIKKKINKLPELPASIEDIVMVANQDGFNFLTIRQSHIIAYNSIPLFTNHKDPFDRLIIATALVENLPLISADESFDLYVPQITLIVA